MNLEDLLPGSYKGADFLLTAASVKGGNRNAIHTYVNTNRQKVENIGQTPRSFDLSIIIPSDNYVQRRDALIAALSDGKTGVLIHPIYGRIENMMAGPYTLNENLSNLGRGDLTVSFFLDNAPGVPEVSGTTVNTVIAKREIVTAANVDQFASDFTVTPGYIGNTESAISAVSSASSAMSQVQSVSVSASEYLNDAQTMASDAAALIRTPANLADRIMGLYDAAKDLYDDPKAAYKYFVQNFFFGENGDTATMALTAGQLERLKNTNAFNLLMQMGATAYAYTIAAQITFDTVGDVQLVEDELEAQYARIMVKALDPTLSEALTELRLAVSDLFTADKLQARKVIEVTTHPTSARLLSFAYYGDSSLGGQIMQLNGLFDPSYMEGTVKVLTE